MKTMKIILILILFFFTGCLCSYMVSTFKPDKKNDMVTINRIVQEVTYQWDSMEGANFTDYSYPFSVLALDETVLYQSSSKAVHRINDAVAYGEVVLNVEHNDEIVGKVIITVNRDSAFRTLQKLLSQIIFLSFTSFTIICGFYFFICRERLFSLLKT